MCLSCQFDCTIDAVCLRISLVHCVVHCWLTHLTLFSTPSVGPSLFAFAHVHHVIFFTELGSRSLVHREASVQYQSVQEAKYHAMSRHSSVLVMHHLTAVMVLVFLACICAIAGKCSALILEFDGSWRPSPRDPIPGFRSQTSHSSFSSATAAASAALFRNDVDENGNSVKNRLFAIGAKSLSDTRTSADAEYEGLLMGLDQLEIALSSHDGDVSVEHHEELIIRGDCKAVIDQLNSRSNPRKTEKYYEQAVEKIKRIRDCSSVTTIAFELVPRESNTLCDTLCKLVLNIDQKRVCHNVQDMICSGEEESLSKEQNGVAINSMKKRRIKTKMVRPKSNHYKVAMEEIRNSSRICQSSKLALACLLSKSAVRTNDVAILLQLSDFFLQSSRLFTKIYWGDSFATKETLRAVSILCELLAKHSIGAEEEAQQIRTKHNIIACEDGGLAEKLDTILEFCTNNINEMQDALLPYSKVVTSELIDGGKYSQKLLEWNTLASGVKDLQSGVWLTINS